MLWTFPHWADEDSTHHEAKCDMTAIESSRSLTIGLPPSCIEFWPYDPEYAVVGTYHLEKSGQDLLESSGEGKQAGQQRNGSLILYKVYEDELTAIQTLATPYAILDVHFGPPYVPASCFGVATSTGSISLYDLQIDASRPGAGRPLAITHIRTIQYFPEDVLVTAFSWHPHSNAVGTTLSTGQVCLCEVKFHENVKSTLSVVIATHDLEAWTLSFLPDGSGMFSGGDDSVLQFSELAQNVNHFFDNTTKEIYGSTRRISWTDKKIHGAGVTAILPLHSNEEHMLVLTGSYDDHIRLIYAPIAGKRTVLADLNLGGGVWRLKRLVVDRTEHEAAAENSEEILLLASCMHAGARILRLSRDQSRAWKFEILAKFDEHKSMNYGSDYQHNRDQQGQRSFITTSFYDRLLCLWRF